MRFSDAGPRALPWIELSGPANPHPRPPTPVDVQVRASRALAEQRREDLELKLDARDRELALLEQRYSNESLLLELKHKQQLANEEDSLARERIVLEQTAQLEREANLTMLQQESELAVEEAKHLSALELQKQKAGTEKDVAVARAIAEAEGETARERANVRVPPCQPRGRGCGRGRGRAHPSIA